MQMMIALETASTLGAVTKTVNTPSRRGRIAVIAALCLAFGSAIVPDRADAAGINAAFKGQSMWVWNMPRTEGGNVAKIVARAKAAGVSAVYVKSADGSGAWKQFNRTLVNSLHAAGLRVCGWQFVYGAKPTGEARAAAAAKAAGADCMIIDAESAYEGRYRSARTYMKELRRLVGAKYPLGFTSFPYVDYHPSLPYSVFLGPGGAEVNMPQVYWRDIGDSVSAAMKHTWRENRIYGRPIHPIGQTYQSPSTSEILSFRRLADGYKAPGYSWWEWSTTSTKLWKALGQALPAAKPQADPGWPLLRKGSKGDPVVRAQQLLAAAGAAKLKATGSFDNATVAAVKAFQTKNQLAADGRLGAATWKLLGKVTVALARSRNAARASNARQAAASAGVPQSSTLPARKNELRGAR
jgi:hypothetical protein